jgi:hypothetical protein
MGRVHHLARRSQGASVTGRATPYRAADRAVERRYPLEPWAWGFCVGYLAVWRVLRVFGVDLDE